MVVCNSPALDFVLFAFGGAPFQLFTLVHQRRRGAGGAHQLVGLCLLVLLQGRLLLAETWEGRTRTLSMAFALGHVDADGADALPGRGPGFMRGFSCRLFQTYVYERKAGGKAFTHDP